MKPHAAMLLCLLCAATGPVQASAPEVSFERYRVILERKPFGDLPVADVPVAPNTPPADSFAKVLRLSMITENDDGSIRVGFVNTQNNKSYLLGEGQSEDGIELVSANFQDEEAVLRRGAEMAVIKLQSGVVQDVSPTDMQARLAAARNRPSIEERRRLRQQQDAQPPPQPKYTGEELAKHLHDYQMEVIRQGLPPLPIPLTPEQDAELVKEGLLPPMK